MRKLRKQFQWERMKKIHLRLLQEIPPHELRITFPTLLTVIRIILVPLIVGAMATHRWGYAFWFFVAASLTDFFDGNLARMWNQKTFLGACLDPIADKLLLISFFFTLVFIDTPLFAVPLWFVILALIKELILICGAAYILLSGKHLDVRPTFLGKATTVVQMLFILWLFTCYYFHWLPVKTYYAMLALMFSMLVLSFVQYVRIGLRQATGVL